MQPLSRTRPLATRAGGRHRAPTSHVYGNLGARLVALASVALVTVLVARSGGAEDVGLLALMRVLPGVVGVVSACGLPGAMGFFVGGAERAHPRLWPTIHVLMAAGATLGTAVWMLLSGLIHDHLMSTTTFAVVVLTGVTVATQLPVAVGKACLQALGDTRGANLVTAAEEAVFVPVLAVGWWIGLRSGPLLVVSLLLADVLVSALAWRRLRARTLGHPFVGRWDLPLARRMATFGMRAQVGGILSLLNLRLDVVILGALAGPAPVGVYVVASKVAELLRLPALALTWVTYPQFAARAAARSEAAAAADPVGPVRVPSVRALLGLGTAMAAVVAAGGFLVLPALYGEDFRAACWPAAWIALGLMAEPAAGVASGFLLGTGRPGLNSTILGAGFVVTVALDAVLIPTHGSDGAAWASAVAYLVTDVLLVRAWCRLRGDP